MKLPLIALAGLIAGSGAACFAETNVADRIDAGLWEITSTVAGDKQAPGVGRRCLTSEQAAKGPEAMLLDGQPDCTVARSSMTGGKLDAQVQCGAGTAKAMTIAIKASFAPKSYEAVSEITLAGGGAATRINVTGKWVGACSN